MNCRLSYLAVFGIRDVVIWAGQTKSQHLRCELIMNYKVRRAAGQRRVRSPAPVPVPGSWSSGPLDYSPVVQFGYL